MASARPRRRSKEAADNDDTDQYPELMKPTNLMKAALDDGEIHAKSPDRDFTRFLDLRSRFHKEFMENLRECALDGRCPVEELIGDEVQLRFCAFDFLDKYGQMYWGTPENRKVYLDPRRLEKHDELAMLPDREEEIVRTIMILLEKKAKRDWKANDKSGLANEFTDELRTSILPFQTPVAPRLSSAAASDGSDIPFAPVPELKTLDKPRKKKKRNSKSTTTVQTEVESPLDSHKPSPGIRPSGAISSPTDWESANENSKKRKLWETEMDLSGIDITSNASIAAEERAESTSRHLSSRPPTPIELAHKHETKFLVSASTQRDMAPVWVDYKPFDSSSEFLGAMADECLSEWDPSAQLNNEIRGLPWSHIPAASVRFEWTDFNIRVRPGKDGDWESVMKRLEKAWSGKDHSADLETQPAEFRIDVMFHV